MDRRNFLKVIGASGISIGLSGLMGCGHKRTTFRLREA